MQVKLAERPLEWSYPDAAVAVCRMQPVSFGGCAGWYHGVGGNAATTAVLLCPGLRTDGLTGHRSFRLVADALAQAGYPVLRFDYPGTADSADLGDAEPWRAWLDSIHAAADWLRTHSGARRLVLAGLRMGATLAVCATAEREDVAGLLLLAPVLRGRSYIRQATIEAAAQPASNQSGGLLLHELDLPAATVKQIAAIDLAAVPLPGGLQIAVYAQSPSPVLTRCVAAWRARGNAVECHDFTGHEAMLRPGFMAHEPPVRTDRIVEWIRRTVPTGTREQSLPEIAPASLAAAGWVETPLQFGPQGRLFGVLCRPAGPVEGDRAVIIGNSSGDPRYGFARGACQLARRLAASGTASLRMDFAGLGDSIAADDAPSHVFETDRQVDWSAALDALQDIGFRRFAAHGLCSGAYHAFHAALADPRIDSLLLVNFPLFQWQHGDAIEFMSHSAQKPAQVLHKLRRRDVWRRLLRGELHLATRLTTKAKAVVARPAASGGSFAQDSMAQLAPRVRTLFLFGGDDAGIAALEQVFGPGRAPPGATLQIAPGLDHALSTAAMRSDAADAMIAFLRCDRS